MLLSLSLSPRTLISSIDSLYNDKAPIPPPWLYSTLLKLICRWLRKSSSNFSTLQRPPPLRTNSGIWLATSRRFPVSTSTGQVLVLDIVPVPPDLSQHHNLNSPNSYLTCLILPFFTFPFLLVSSVQSTPAPRSLPATKVTAIPRFLTESSLEHILLRRKSE